VTARSTAGGVSPAGSCIRRNSGTHQEIPASEEDNEDWSRQLTLLLSGDAAVFDGTIVALPRDESRQCRPTTVTRLLKRSYAEVSGPMRVSAGVRPEHQRERRSSTHSHTCETGSAGAWATS
jgi:hypothetical protein